MGSASLPEGSFTAPPELHSFEVLLFDFDGEPCHGYAFLGGYAYAIAGTIIDSTNAIVKHWHKLGKELGVDPNVILATSHGRRSIDVLKLYDDKRANWEYISHMEGLIPKEFGQDAVEIPGARKLLSSLDLCEAPWAVVTSGTRALVNGWLEVMKLAHPKHMVVAEDVDQGKPDPACYLLGRKRLGLENGGQVLVIEDAPSGIRAGKAAGFKVVGLTTTHSFEQVKDAGADWIVQDLQSLVLKQYSNRAIGIEIRNAFVI